MHTSTVELDSNNDNNFTAFLAVPDVPNGGSVVVLQEIFGINENIRQIVRGFAEDGYYAIAPDIFWRQEPGVELDPSGELDRERATALLKGLNQAQAAQDAALAADYLRGLSQSNGRVASVGYCLGGKLAYLMAANGTVECAVSYYGVAIQASLDLVSSVSCPLLLHIAQDDHLCPQEAQEQILAAMAPYSDKISILSHAGVGHAFARRGGGTYNAQAAAHADAATAKLLNECLKA